MPLKPGKDPTWKGCKEFLIRFQLHHLLIAIKFVRRNIFAFCLLKVNLVMTFNKVVYCVVTDPAPSQRHDRIGMMTA